MLPWLRLHLVPSTWCPPRTHPPFGHPHAAQLRPPAPVPPTLQEEGRPLQGANPLAGAPRHPPAPPRRCDARGIRAGPRSHHGSPLRPAALGGTRAPPPPPLPAAQARDEVHTFVRGREVTAIHGVHLVRLASTTPRDPRGPRGLSPTHGWELWRTPPPWGMRDS